jgi:very-short-patch-repair endonuclease
MTLPEVLLWEQLRGQRLEGLRFRRQHPIGPYVLDFYCPSAKLAIEVDGAVHDSPDQALSVGRRDAWLNVHGVRVLRFDASEILQDDRFEGVLKTIAHACAMSGPLPPPPPSAVPLPRCAGEDHD